jgi:hypothetical protein
MVLPGFPSRGSGLRSSGLIHRNVPETEGGDEKADVSVGIIVVKPKSARQDVSSCLMRIFAYGERFPQLHCVAGTLGSHTHSFQIPMDQPMRMQIYQAICSAQELAE